MHFILFIIYFLILCCWIKNLSFFTSALNFRFAILFFTVYVLTGCLHNWIAFRFFPNHGDIWKYFDGSVVMKKWLLAEPGEFLHHLFSNNNKFNVTDRSQPLLDIQYQVIQYIHTGFNFLSFNNLYINTLFFSFIVFAGAVALFKSFITVYNSPLPAIVCLLLPSILFWMPVVYKDGLFYMSTGFFFYFFLQSNRPVLTRFLLLLVFTLLMFSSKANTLATILPAVLFLVFIQNKLAPVKTSLLITIAVVILGLVAFNYLLPDGLLHSISNRQKEFQGLTGGSRLYLPLLEPTWKSIMVIFPVAAINGCFQPLPGVGGKIIYTAFSIELILVWAIVFYGCFLAARNKKVKFRYFDMSCLLCVLPGMIIIGYMVPFTGAIIRYRSVYLPFLLAPFINIIYNCRIPVAIAAHNWLRKYVMADTTIMNEKFV